MKTQELHQLFLVSQGVSTDSRENLKGKIFFALKGENFNGNIYARKALENGAMLAVVDDPDLKEEPNCFWVEDVLLQLQDLARFHRKFLGIPILAITGSNGKTTTKELVAAVLSEKYKVTFTQGNLNNHIGVPLTLLQMNAQTEFGVVEMGANHQKEIQLLCEIAQPDYGYITNFGKAHLEGFGGFEGVVKGKSELYDYLKTHQKKIFVHQDDPIQVEQSRGGDLILFSQESESDCLIQLKNANPFVEVIWEDLRILSRLIGVYNAKNIAFAICVGAYFGVLERLILSAIESYKPDNNRSQIIRRGSNQIVLDAYNANPTSMSLALESFMMYPGEKKIVVLGDMFEVGQTEVSEHQGVVDWLEKSSLDEMYVCGNIFCQTKVNKVQKFNDFEELKAVLMQKRYEDASILIKGSRGMAMERVLEVI